ncbi:ABC transporter permease subunit [Streptomyces sp. HC44]|uniref:ABC transporter permease subunit n=2 Tax=Streptomyces scabichelini TaxID=2711217 RepID=A0A6G4VDY3_9ACTN|nr:ABC transporter permease subunit [Streptomyces scabichelini]
MEWIKLRSLRSTTYALLAVVVGMIAVGVVTMANTKAPGNAADAETFDPVNNLMAGVALGQLIIGVLGVLAVTGEYSSGSIRSTLAAVPNRRLLLVAKAAVLGAVALVVGQTVAFVTFFAGRPALTDAVPQPSLGDGGVLRAVVLSGVYLAMIGLIGVGIGAITRHTAGAIGTLVGLLFVVPAILAGATGTTVAKFFPTMIAGNSLAVSRAMPDVLSPWAGFGMLCLYTALALGVGGRLLARRDA